MFGFLQMAPPPKWPDLYVQFDVCFCCVPLTPARSWRKPGPAGNYGPLWIRMELQQNPPRSRALRRCCSTDLQSSLHRLKRGISLGTCDTSLLCSCRAACCWRPLWGTCSHRWAPRHSRCGERQRWRYASGCPQWWLWSSSWAHRSGWWSGRRCHELWRQPPRSHQCGTCNSQSPFHHNISPVCQWAQTGWHFQSIQWPSPQHQWFSYKTDLVHGLET